MKPFVSSIDRSGPPAHWERLSYSSFVSTAFGDVWFAPETADRDEGLCGFLADERHLNRLGVVHGGALATLADISLWRSGALDADAVEAVTVTLNTEFLASAKEGEWVWSSGEVVRGGGKMVFARGLIHAGETPVLSYSGTLKRITRR